jgi:hypothetical protein
MPIFALMFIFLLQFSISFAQQGRLGGATSGGGDEVGIEATQVLNGVVSMIENTNQFDKRLVEISKEVKIFVTDRELPNLDQAQVLSSDAFVVSIQQSGVAYSIRDNSGARIFIQRQRWEKLSDSLFKESLLFHELAVLSGVEATGDYKYTRLFFEKRGAYWESMKSMTTVCTVALFSSIKQTTGNFLIGEFLGANSFKNAAGVSAGMKVLYDIEPHNSGKPGRAVIFNYVLSGHGHLRGFVEIADASYFNRNQNVFITKTYNRSEKQVYLNPYAGKVNYEAHFSRWENYYIQVGCSKLPSDI